MFEDLSSVHCKRIALLSGEISGLRMHGVTCSWRHMLIGSSSHLKKEETRLMTRAKCVIPFVVSDGLMV